MPLPPLLRRALLAAALLAIGVATLYPATAEDPEPLVLCLLCGDQAASDALTNILLFIPLGTALALLDWRPRGAILTASLLSGAVECAQLLVIPGRDPSLGDVLFNTLGGAAGVLLIRSASAWLHPPPQRAHILLATWVALALGVFLATGWLLSPALPAATYFGQWTPNLGHLAWYRGRVIDARLGALPLPPRPLPDSAAVRRLLLDGAPLRVEAVAGPRTGEVAPLFSVYDDRQREILLLGPDRDDLVFRHRLHAAAFGLDQPDLRLLGAMRDVRRGDTLTAVAHRAGDGWCLTLNRRTACRQGFTLGRAWALFMFPEGFPSWMRRLLDAGWMAGMLLPLGLWARPDRFSLAAAGVLVAGVLLAPALTGLRPFSFVELLGLLGGVAGGRGLRAFATLVPARSA